MILSINISDEFEMGRRVSEWGVQSMRACWESEYLYYQTLNL